MTVISRTAANPQYGLDGATEAPCLRVHPKGRDLLVAGGCYGIWKIGGEVSTPMDYIEVATAPMSVTKGQTYDVTINYTAVAATTIKLQWFATNPNQWLKTTSQTISDQDGTLKLSLTIPTTMTQTTVFRKVLIDGTTASHQIYGVTGD